MRWYVAQPKSYGMGNFINCTPTIQTLYEHFGEAIPVYFDTPAVASMFANWKAIRPIKQHNGYERLFGSNMVNRKIPDYQYIHHNITQQLGIKRANIPHSYVDAHEPPAPWQAGEYVVIARGGVAGGFWEEKKEVGDEIYRHIMERIALPKVIIGNDADYTRSLHRMEDWADTTLVLNDVVKSLGLLNGARYVIANDTGMYHAAGALKKDVFVIWKDTPFVKNKSPHKGCFYSQKGSWESDFKTWVARR